MTKDELEFSISQYLDGALAARERDALDERLATDAEARALFAEYQSLQGVLAAAPMPDVKWEAFAAHISGAVAREELPAQSYKIGQWMPRTTWAVAASVLIAGGIGFSLIRGDGGGGKTSDAEAPVSIVVNDASGTPEATPTTIGAERTKVIATGPEPTIVIAIGPAPSTGDAPIVLRYADSVVQRPSKALIVSAASVAQDNPPTPF